MNTKYVIIVAGGSGSRMKSLLPKQFLELNGTPVIMHTLKKFHDFDAQLKIILVLPADQFDLWNELCIRHHFNIAYQLVAGGDTRYQSVKNGLSKVSGEGLVAVHDGVRPLVSHETISRCFTMAASKGNAIPVITVHETVRQLHNDASVTIDRNCLRLVQTPQVFAIELLKKAYHYPHEASFTDDASVVERLGATIHLTEGNRENIKITEPSDLLMAEIFIKTLNCQKD